MASDADETKSSSDRADFFGGSTEDIDAFFETALIDRGDVEIDDRPSLTSSVDDRESFEVRALFAQIAAAYVRPVRDFMMELAWGDAPREWVDVCEPAIRSMRRSAESLDYPELCEALDAFGDGLSSVVETNEPTISGEIKERLITTYARLASVMPPAFELDGERGGREPIIIQSLLAQIPDVGKVTTDKLYGAGLTSLEVLCMATPEDITFVTGISADLSERIVTKFQEYRRDIESTNVDATRSTERGRLAEISAELRATDELYRSTSTSWEVAEIAQRRRLRQARTERLLEAYVLLARLGEVDRLRRIERLPYALKIRELEAYLAEAALKSE
jgi:hypothetical protein